MADRTASKEKVENALASLKDGMTALVSSESWIEFLAFQAKFHSYSANNVMLIQLQCPQASRVAGFKAWKELGQNVRKGEKGLAILAPCKRTIENEETGEKRSFVAGFRVVYVFDVSQLDEETLAANPLPESPGAMLDGNGSESLRLELVAQIEAAGFSCADGDAEAVSAGANGYTDFLARKVVIGAELPLAQRVKTTAHELAHVLMHDPQLEENKGPKAVHRKRSLIECEAESVAYVVLHALGFDAGAYSFGYVAGWSGGNVEVVEAVAKRVKTAASKVLETMAARETAAA